MLHLPNVSLVMVETQVHDLARVALLDAMAKVKWGDVIVYTDRPEAVAVDGVRVITVPNWTDKLKAESFYYNEAAQGATTSHVLMYQWDAGVRDVTCWSDDFLSYDYIGAPWPGKRGGQWEPKPGLTVGNGGFTLMSKKLCDHLFAQRAVLGVNSDHTLSVGARPRIEAAIGAKWAPEDIAFRFAFEHGNAAERGRPSFGYHDVFNWHLAMGRDEVIERARMMMANRYVVKTGKLRSLNDACPWVQATIGLDYIHASNMMNPPRARIGSPARLHSRGVKA